MNNMLLVFNNAFYTNMSTRIFVVYSQKKSTSKSVENIISFQRIKALKTRAVKFLIKAGEVVANRKKRGRNISFSTLILRKKPSKIFCNARFFNAPASVEKTILHT